MCEAAGWRDCAARCKKSSMCLVPSDLCFSNQLSNELVKTVSTT